MRTHSSCRPALAELLGFLLVLNWSGSSMKADESTNPPVTTPLTSVAGTVVTPLDGTWQIVHDTKHEGEAAAWFNPGAFPVAQARPIPMPGVPTEIFPTNAWWNDAPGEQYWYFRTFSVQGQPAAHVRYYLRFGAVRQISDVWLNGVHLGTHDGGEDPFEYDVTQRVRPGANTLVVRVKMNLIGGIWQGVKLVEQPDVRIIDSFARPDAKGKKIDLEVTLENNSGAPATVDVTAALGEFRPACALGRETTTVTAAPGLSTASLVLPVAQPHLWNLGDPFLYTIRVTSAWRDGGTVLGRDSESFRTGFRDFRVVDGFFYLNGRRIFPACAHGNNYDPILMQGTSRRMTYMEKELDQLKRAGFNMMRCIVSAALPEQLDYADEHGMLFFTEHETSWLIHDPAVFGRTLNQVVRRDRNHPSLVLWGLLNETDNLEIYQRGRDWLPQLRAIDDTRPVLLSSGRWDRDFKTASLSNAGSRTWDTYLGGEDPQNPKPTSPDESVGGAFKNGTGDAHIYTSWPTNWETMNKFLALAHDTRPFFLSEEGMGTSYDPITESAELDRLQVPHDLFCWSFPQRGLDGMRQTWSTYGLAATYPDMHDFVVDSDLSGARQRALVFTMVRGNPKINGYNLTSIEDFWGGAEGIMNNFRDFKPGTLEVMREGWAPLRWCLLVNPTTAYAGQDLHVRVGLANLDVLPAGNWDATLRIVGPRGEVWKQTVTAPVQANGPLAYTLFDQDVSIPHGELPEGKYSLEAKLDGHANAAASRYDFTIVSRNSLPRISGEVVVAGLPQNIQDLLKAQGARLRDFAADGNADRETILVGGDFKGDAAAWRALYGHVAQGAHLVFLDEKVFKRGEDANGWLAVAEKGGQNTDAEWLYHKDCIAKTGSTVFAGLPAKLMDPDEYGQMLANAHFFTAITVPDETAAVAIRSTLGNRYEYKDGVMIGTYKLGAGRFTINAFDLAGTIGHPATDRMVLNLVAAAQADAVPAAAAPVDFAAMMDKLGIVDPPLAK